MREIKFRVWDKDAERMWDIETWHIADEYVDLIEPGKNIVERFWRKQSEIILMQFTGLHDKNGRKIYEGDLFEHRFGYTVFDDPPHAEMGTEYGVVTFDNGQFVVSTPGWGGRNLYELLLLNGHLNDMPDSDLFTMKAAGNIFENPELLEDK